MDVFLLKHTLFNEWFFIRLSEKQNRILHSISAQLGDRQKEWAREEVKEEEQNVEKDAEEEENGQFHKTTWQSYAPETFYFPGRQYPPALRGHADPGND